LTQPTQPIDFTWEPSTDPQGDSISYCIVINDCNGNDEPSDDTTVFNTCDNSQFIQDTIYTLPASTLGYDKSYTWTVFVKDDKGNFCEGVEWRNFTTQKATVDNTLYVDDDNSGFENGSKEYPFNTIQEGIDAAADGYTVKVGEGYYYDNIVISKNIILQGGWNSDFSQSHLSTYTTIDGGGNGTVVYFDNTDSSSVIKNFFITNGNAEKGGGIYCNYSSPTIINNFISGNKAYSDGGGICTSNYTSDHPYFSSPKIINNTITGNVVKGDLWWAHYDGDIYRGRGGGLFIACAKNQIIIKNNVISYNYAGLSGGGLYIGAWINNPVIIENNIISNNYAWVHGGGIKMYPSSGTLHNNLIVNNIANFGAGIWADVVDPIMSNLLSIVNNTICNNMKPNGNGGNALYILATGGPNASVTVFLKNGIIWNNDILIGGQNQLDPEERPNIIEVTWTDHQYELSESIVDGPGNISLDPYFVDPANGDYSLQPWSPCINTGDPDPQYNDPDDTRSDMGYKQ